MLDVTKKTVMRDFLLLFINGDRVEIRGADVFETLSRFLRNKRRLTGTKVVCEEGDCGSCTVLVGRSQGSTIHYQTIDACIAFLHQLDGCHIVTVEGLSRDRTLTPVQQAMIDCHGSQCGFCTPGFVVAMTGMLESAAALDDHRLRHGLTGNLCRCTGYAPIFAAGRATDIEQHRVLNELYPPAQMLAAMSAIIDDEIEIAADVEGARRLLFAPTTVERTVELRQTYPHARLVAGATDIGVQRNKGASLDEVIIDLNRVDELTSIDIAEDKVIAASRATWAALEDVFAQRLPQFAEIISIFGSPQIRHMGTLGGNLVNASPIADSLPLLYVLEAELTLASAAGNRVVNINDFYQAYKQFDLRPDELLTQISIPLPRPEEILQLTKVSRRRDLDIATFTSAIRMALDGETISSASIAMGAVGPVVLRAPQTEMFLQGKSFTEATMRQAGDMVIQEITPISDVRGSDDFRYQLARNVLIKSFFEAQQNQTAST